MKVVILHHDVAPGDSAADQDVLVQAEEVSKALDELGHAWETVPCTLDLERMRRRLSDRRPDVVFQLVESLGGSDQLAYLATGVLDALGLRYTGSSTQSLLLTNDKLLAKERMARAGLPTPEWIVLPSWELRGDVGRSPGGGFLPGERYVIKTIHEHASFGLDEHSLVQFGGETELEKCLQERARQLGRACFAERFIEGREFNLSVLAGRDGPEVLPPAEIDFSAFPPGKPRIVGTRAKWADGSFEFVNTPRRFDFPSADRPLLDQLVAAAKRCWRLFGLGGYVRVDFRVDAEGRPWVLEINTNPCLSPDAGFAAALREAGIPFPRAVQRILDDACL